MQQQNYLMLPDAAAVKQEPISPKFDLTTTTPPPSQRYTPSPNPLPSTSFSPDIQMQSVSHQPQCDMMSNIPSVSPLQHANNILINNQQQYQTQTQQSFQYNIPNTTMTNTAVNFLNNNNQIEQRNIDDILANNNNLDNLNQFNNLQTTNNGNNELDSVSGMNISSLLDLDSQQQINTNELGISNDLLNDLLKNIGNGDVNQCTTPMAINAIQTNNFEADEDNMTDSFKQISIE